jgi:hypothetical protein
MIDRRHFLKKATVASVGLGTAGALSTAPFTREPTERPHLFITATGGGEQALRSVDEVRRAVRSGFSKQLWDDLQARTKANLDADPILPTTMYPGRDPREARKGIRSNSVVRRARRRVTRPALACLLTEDPRFKDAALRQIEALFDEDRWAIWRDQAHESFEADLRTGALARDLAIAYDWLYPFLSSDEQRWIIDGIDRRGTQRYLEGVEQEDFWLNDMTNWMIRVVGGFGVAGMALGEDYEKSDRLVELALPRMRKYLRRAYGPEGSFNEGVVYVNDSVFAVAFFMAHWYDTGGRVNRLAERPFPQLARWLMYATLPPGRLAPFGDTDLDDRPRVSYLPAIAAAARDGLVQWFYRQYRDEEVRGPFELLWFDESVHPVSPEGRLPHGRAFEAFGGLVSSRTSWDPLATTSVAYGKTAIEENHEHHDAGQVAIDGYGRHLIIDVGSPPGYPPDFFGPNRYEYYNASSFGHNVLTFGGREMNAEPGESGRLLQTAFSDEKGGFWQVDLSTFYDRARRVRRTVVHLCPSHVVVLDEARLADPDSVSLRWHTANDATPEDDGSFVVENEDVKLAARVAPLGRGEDALSFRRREHAYRPPHDQHRAGHPLKQRHESFVEVTLDSAEHVRLLSLFSVFGPDQEPAEWTQEGARWSLAPGEGTVQVRASRDELSVLRPGTSMEWTVELRSSN